MNFEYAIDATLRTIFWYSKSWTNICDHKSWFGRSSFVTYTCL